MYDHDLWRAGLPGIEQSVEPGPFKVFQGNRLIGTVPSYPVKSTSGIFDVRPGDFTFVEKDGERVLVATGMIGPGDFACIEGFTPGEGVPTCYSDNSDAREFDALMKTTGSRFAAIDTLIRDKSKG